MNKNIQTINILFVLSNIILVFYYISIGLLNEFEEKGGLFAFMWFILIFITITGLISAKFSYEEESKKGKVKYMTEEDKASFTLCINILIMVVVGFGVLMLNLLKIDHKEKNICEEKNIYIEEENENK